MDIVKLDSQMNNYIMSYRYSCASFNQLSPSTNDNNTGWHKSCDTKVAA